MDIYTCKKCKRMTRSLIRGICQDCYDEMEGKFLDVKEYIYDHPGAMIAEVSEEFDLPANYIESWIREGRIMIGKNNTGMMVHCQQCGNPITSGKLCGACISKMGKQLRALGAAGVGQEKEKKASFRNTKY